MNSCSAGIVDADKREAVPVREVHYLAYLLGMGEGEAAAEHGKILGKDVDPSAVDAAEARYHTFTRYLGLGHAEISAAVCHEFVHLFKGAVVEKFQDPLARGHLACLMLF